MDQIKISKRHSISLLEISLTVPLTGPIVIRVSIYFELILFIIFKKTTIRWVSYDA